MMPPRPRRPRSRILILSAALAFAACHGWTDVPVDTTTVREGASVRVLATDGSRFVLAHVVVRGDSLFGEEPGCRWRLALASTPGRSWCSGIAIAHTDVARLETRVPAPYRTNMAILFFGLVWCAVLVACMEVLSQARPRAREGRSLVAESTRR